MCSARRKIHIINEPVSLKNNFVIFDTNHRMTIDTIKEVYHSVIKSQNHNINPNVFVNLESKTSYNTSYATFKIVESYEDTWRVLLSASLLKNISRFNKNSTLQEQLLLTACLKKLAYLYKPKLEVLNKDKPNHFYLNCVRIRYSELLKEFKTQSMQITIGLTDFLFKNFKAFEVSHKDRAYYAWMMYCAEVPKLDKILSVPIKLIEQIGVANFIGKINDLPRNIIKSYGIAGFYANVSSQIKHMPVQRKTEVNNACGLVQSNKQPQKQANAKSSAEQNTTENPFIKLKPKPTPQQKPNVKQPSRKTRKISRKNGKHKYKAA